MGGCGYASKHKRWVRAEGKARTCPRCTCCAFTYLPRRIRLLPVDVLEHLLQLRLQQLVLGARVELAHEVAVVLEVVGGEGEGRVAEVLYFVKTRERAGQIQKQMMSA